MGVHRSLASITSTLAILSACGGSDLLLPSGKGDLLVVSGDNQRGETGKRLAKPLVVQVNGEDGRPAAGVVVAFAGSSGNPAVDPDSAATDDNGQASTRVTLGDAEGTQVVQAQLAAASSNLSVEFHVMAVAPAGGGGGGAGGVGGGGGGGGGGGDHHGNGDGHGNGNGHGHGDNEG